MLFIILISFLVLVFSEFSSLRNHFWPLLSTERKPVGGYAENAETLRTTDYADVWMGPCVPPDTDALQIRYAIHRALQIRVISGIRG
jgi:hypothetical protein